MNPLKIIKHTSLALILSYSMVSSASTIYKWIDDKGQTHFGQNPPEHVQAEQISPKKRSFGQYTEMPIESSSPTAVEPEQEQPAQVESQQAAVEEVFKKDAKLCKQAQENKRLLMQHPIIRRQGKVLTVEEKNKELSDIEEVIKVHC